MREATPMPNRRFRMRTTRTLLFLMIGTVLVLPARAQKKLTAADAKDHVGETATVCGNVVSTRYASSTKGQPTFLNLDKPYPNQIFTAVIWRSNRTKFGLPEVSYNQRPISITAKTRLLQRL